MLPSTPIRRKVETKSPATKYNDVSVARGTHHRFSDLVLLNGRETGAAALDGPDVNRKHISAIGAFAESDTCELIFALLSYGAVAQFRAR